MSKNSNIVSKLKSLEEYTSYLKDLQKVNKKNFLTDYHFFGAAERYLQLSIQTVLDIAKLIIINENFKRPDEPREVIHILYDNKIINKSLIEKLSGVTGFRNILVHEYEKINREIVYGYVHEKLGIFDAFKKAIAKYLDR